MLPTIIILYYIVYKGYLLTIIKKTYKKIKKNTINNKIKKQ